MKWKNFLSTGDVWTTIDLCKNTTTLVLGENGSGKSTMLDALCFALFGKPFRKINKPQLINSVNENGCVTEVEFEIGTNVYKVIRGIKPGKFEIYYNKILLDQTAASRDYQEHLEKNILKLNHTTFTQVVILGASTFVPFMQLSAQARREIIEDLLDIKIFTLMNSLLKNRMQENKDVLQNLKIELVIDNEKKNLHEKHVKSLLSDNKTKKQKVLNDIEKIKKDVIVLNNTIKEKREKIDDMRESIIGKTDIKDSLQKMGHYKSKILYKIDKNNNDIVFYSDNNNCPTCTQPIDEIIKQKKLNETKENESLLNENLNKLQLIIDDNHKHMEKIESILKMIGEIETDIRTDESKKQSLKSYALKLNENMKEIDNINLDEEKQMLHDIIENIKTVEIQREEYINARELLSTASDLLKDKGIKTQIVKQYIPIMNTLINKYLAKMEFFVNFELDENFNETIKSRHRDIFSYASFSEGEKSRLDLALLLTWRSIAKMKNSSHTNLLILDEVFDGSLDGVGIETLIEILNEIKNTNIFIISHKGDFLQDKMRSVIRFEKYKNFSRIIT